MDTTLHRAKQGHTGPCAIVCDVTDAQLVSTAAAAAALGVNRRTLWRWIAEGKVQAPARTAGGHLRWDLAQLRAQVDAARPDTT